MKALKYIFFLLLIIIIAFAIYIAVQPSSFSFERSKTINAPASLIYNKVNDYKEWPSFSPWLELEKEAILTYGDKTSGVDASYSWNGEVLGEGSMKTISEVENKSISQHLSFIKPFKSESDINWTFTPTDEGTKVTWAMEGDQDFMTKMYTTFSGSIEKNTAPSFERGLFKLDSIVQNDMKKYNIVIDKEPTTHSGGYYIYNTTSCKFDDFETKMKEMLPKVRMYAQKNNITMAGAPFILYHKWDEENNAVMFSCCVPTTARVITTESDILTGQLQPFKAIKTTLKGDYDNLKEAWDKAMAFIPENGYTISENGPMIESYLTDPMRTPNPADWKTEIYIAIE